MIKSHFVDKAQNLFKENIFKIDIDALQIWIDEAEKILVEFAQNSIFPLSATDLTSAPRSELPLPEQEMINAKRILEAVRELLSHEKRAAKKSNENASVEKIKIGKSIGYRISDLKNIIDHGRDTNRGITIKNAARKGGIARSDQMRSGIKKRHENIREIAKEKWSKFPNLSCSACANHIRNKLARSSDNLLSVSSIRRIIKGLKPGG